MSKNLRRARDSARLFLMRRQRNVRVNASGESIDQELDGDSPPTDERPATEGAAQPIEPAADPRTTRLPGRFYRPRIIQQLNLSVGSDIDSPDVYFRYGSFGTLRQLWTASESPPGARAFSFDELALCIGVTPALLRSMVLWKRRYYRRFEIPKRTGGNRIIEAPRVFLKAVQQWIVDYMFAILPIHDACHSYRTGRSIISNAAPHIGKRYVACIDIENFFPSINKPSVTRILGDSGYWPDLSNLLASLCTLNGSLPQGAPSSPTLSNSYLYTFDKRLTEFATRHGVAYTRYADDLTFSGDHKERVVECVGVAAQELEDFGLRLRKDKTRIISKQGQQRVTGIVVNESGYPPREFRRAVRAAFHAAANAVRVSKSEYDRLNGLLNYMKQFDGLHDSVELGHYAEVLAQLEVNSGAVKAR